MAASLSPCSANFCLAFCNWTSCALQKGHQSADRKKRITVPREPLSVLLDCSCPNWSRRANAGAGCPIGSPIEAADGADGICADTRAAKAKPKPRRTAAPNFITHLAMCEWKPGQGLQKF